MPQDFIADCPLPGDDQRIVERMHEDHPSLARQFMAPHLRIRVAVAEQHDLGPEIAYRIHLDLRSRLRHDDDRADLEMACGIRHSLGVVAGARGDDTARPFFGAQMRDPVVSAAQFVAEDRLQVLPLQQDLVLQAARQAWCRIERRLLGHVVDAAGQDQPEHLVRRRWSLVSEAGHRPGVTGWMWMPHSSFCPCHRPERGSDGSRGSVVHGSHPILV